MRVEFGPGLYYIGDPCYCLGKEVYHDIWGGKYNYKDGIIPVNETFFAVHETMYGDGCYQSNEHIYFDVDSGTLSMIPISLMEKVTSHGGWTTLEVKEKAVFFYDEEEGTFLIRYDNKELIIWTGYEDEKEDVDDWDDYDEEEEIEEY